MPARRIDAVDRTARVFEIHTAGDDIAVFGDFGPDSHGCVGMHFNDLVAHEPASKIKIMNGVGVEEHAVHAGLISGHRRSILVASNRFEKHRFANFAGFDALHCGGISRVIVTHEANLQSDLLGAQHCRARHVGPPK